MQALITNPWKIPVGVNKYDDIVRAQLAYTSTCHVEDSDGKICRAPDFAIIPDDDSEFVTHSDKVIMINGIKAIKVDPCNPCLDRDFVPFSLLTPQQITDGKRFNELPYGRDYIKKCLPHRDSKLLVDSITEIEPGKSGTGAYVVKEIDCKGHFPGNPIFPGDLYPEMIAQLAGIIFLQASPMDASQPRLAGIDRTRLKSESRPGDTLVIKVRIAKTRNINGSFVLEAEGQVYCGEKRIASSEVLCAVGK